MNWISVKDELPEEEKTTIDTIYQGKDSTILSLGKRYLVRTEDNDIFICIYCPEKKKFKPKWCIAEGAQDLFYENVTHWMPLPEPSEGGERMSIKIDRVWAMPNKWTFTIKPIKQLLSAHVRGIWADPFCGLYSPAQIKNDINPNIDCEYHLDALEFLRSLNSNSFDGVLLDPPYSISQAKECYESHGVGKLKVSVTNMKYWASIKNEISRIIKRGGKAICFGWTSQGLGKNRGFIMKNILLVPHGGSKNDTLCTVEVKE